MGAPTSVSNASGSARMLFQCEVNYYVPYFCECSRIRTWAAASRAGAPLWVRTDMATLPSAQVWPPSGGLVWCSCGAPEAPHRLLAIQYYQRSVPSSDTSDV